ncbi:MAG: LytR C-terminal domain-containing protein [Elusimicrobiota bacterium]
MKLLRLFFITVLIISAIGGIIFHTYTVKKESEKKTEQLPLIPTIGEIEVLNGCGEKGVAEEVKSLLQLKGFNVLGCGNAESFRYEHTIVLSRKENMEIAKKVGLALGIENVISLINNRKLLDVTVIVGRDYKRLFHAK